MIASTQKSRLLLWRGWPHLFVLLLAFFAGAVSGFFVAFLGRDNRELQNYMSDFWNFIESDGLSSPLFSITWDCLRWPLLVLIFSFHSFGAIAIPAIFCVRGFLLSHSFLAISYALPVRGISLYMILFFVTILFIVPTLFLWGCEGLRFASSVRSSSATQKFRVEAILIGIGVLLVAIAIQWALIPYIFNSVFV